MTRPQIGPTKAERPVGPDLRLPIELTFPFNLEEQVDALYNLCIMAAMRRSRSNQTEAAKLLGLSFRAFRYRLQLAEQRTKRIAMEAEL